MQIKNLDFTRKINLDFTRKIRCCSVLPVMGGVCVLIRMDLIQCELLIFHRAINYLIHECGSNLLFMNQLLLGRR